MTYPEQMRRGATFYREVALFSDKEKTIPLDLTDKTPRSTLMTLEGNHVADYGCAVLGSRIEGRIAWVMSRAVLADVTHGVYLAVIYLDDADGETTYEAYSNQVIVQPGQP